MVLGSLEGQAIKVVSKCLWDPNFDNYASVSYKNETLYCVGMVFGCYHEWLIQLIYILKHIPKISKTFYLMIYAWLFWIFLTNMV